MSRRQSAIVDEAMRLVAKGKTRYSVAKKLGLSLSAVYRAAIRNNLKPRKRK